jgi:ABC-type transporter Mla MlaB component
MLKITRVMNGTGPILKLEGTLREAWIAEFRRAWDDATQLRRGTVGLDLSDVTFVDRPGIALLRDLLGKGKAELAACSSFVAAALGLEKP